MLSNDSEARRLFARERVDELAREARLARGPAEWEASRSRERRSLQALRSLLGQPRGEAARSASASRA